MSPFDSLDNDYKLHDAYVAFSAEIVRLALLSPALFTFLVPFFSKDKGLVEFSAQMKPAACSLALGFSAMVAAIFFGLAHRYYATDFMATYIENRRKAGKADPSDRPHTKGDTRSRLRAATFSIALSAFSLFVGAALLLRSLYVVIFGQHG